jgi:hypothetical protein
LPCNFEFPALISAVATAANFEFPAFISAAAAAKPSQAKPPTLPFGWPQQQRLAKEKKHTW